MFLVQFHGEYHKKISETEVEKRTAYEVSINKLEVPRDEE